VYVHIPDRVITMEVNGIGPCTQVHAIGFASFRMSLPSSSNECSPLRLWCWPCLSGGWKPMIRVAKHPGPTRVGSAMSPAPLSVGVRN
jgi:hypothetical protein